MKILPDGWGIASVEDISAVLNSVHNVFQPCFGGNLNPQQLIVAHHNNANPVTLREAGMIFLSAKDNNWCQYAYQFAHEYCHFQFFCQVAQQMRWFEESLCELASYFFLPRIAELWAKSPPYPNWRPYAPNFINYVELDQRKATPFNLDFSVDTENLINLVKNEYNREKNAYVAVTLAPIFQENPALWSVIHYIADIPKKLSFAESLQCWYGLCPDKHRRSIEKIAAIFSLSLQTSP